MSPDLSDLAGPCSADLAAIDAEWPLIAAELDLLDAEITALSADGGLSALDRRRLRRAEQRVMRVAAALGVTSVVSVRLAA